ncbi:MAG TPA: formate hydrogenlyase, partial [Nitrososphaera sp.]
MAESYFLLAATFIPLLLAPVAYVLSRKAGVNAATWLSFGALAVSTGLLIIPAVGIYNGSQEAYVESYTWGQFGDFGLRLDGLSLPFALIIY